MPTLAELLQQQSPRPLTISPETLARLPGLQAAFNRPPAVPPAPLPGFGGLAPGVGGAPGTPTPQAQIQQSIANLMANTPIRRPAPPLPPIGLFNPYSMMGGAPFGGMSVPFGGGLYPSGYGMQGGMGKGGGPLTPGMDWGSMAPRLGRPSKLV